MEFVKKIFNVLLRAPPVTVLVNARLALMIISLTLTPHVKLIVQILIIRTLKQNSVSNVIAKTLNVKNVQAKRNVLPVSKTTNSVEQNVDRDVPQTVITIQ